MSGNVAAPTLEYVFTARVRVAPALEMGVVGGVRRRVIPITGGEISGPRLCATVLPGGADWQSLHGNGVTEVLARYTLRAADGALIGVTNAGVRTGPAEVMRRLAQGEAVDPALYYFRTVPVFAVAEGPHDWLSRHVFVCTGERLPDLVVIRCFLVR
jgi:hypothetical protein